MTNLEDMVRAANEASARQHEEEMARAAEEAKLREAQERAARRTARREAAREAVRGAAKKVVDVVTTPARKIEERRQAEIERARKAQEERDRVNNFHAARYEAFLELASLTEGCKQEIQVEKFDRLVESHKYEPKGLADQATTTIIPTKYGPLIRTETKCCDPQVIQYQGYLKIPGNDTSPDRLVYVETESYYITLDHANYESISFATVIRNEDGTFTRTESISHSRDKVGDPVFALFDKYYHSELAKTQGTEKV